MKKSLFIVLAIVAVLAVGAGTYFYQQRSIDDLNDKNKSLTSSVRQLKAENKILATTEDSSVAPSGSQQPAKTTTYTSEKGVKVVVTAPLSGTKVSSPLTIKGSVPGSWSFEGQFSVRLIDAQGNLLGESPAKLSGNWMTEALTLFSTRLTFGQGASQKGTLVLLKANPSGLASHNDTVVIPVTF